MFRRLLSVIAAAAFLAAAAPASALIPIPSAPLPANPADRLADRAIEASFYQPATRCADGRRPGVAAFASWLSRTTRGVSWGTYRCERWGRNSASLHAEGRALDWHLDASRRADARAARRVIRLLLAPDRLGNPHALARRTGLQEIIWDCAYWGAGMPAFKGYGPCLDRRGALKRRVNPTLAHRDHIHFGFTRAGARGRTSFWQVANPGR